MSENKATENAVNPDTSNGCHRSPDEPQVVIGSGHKTPTMRVEPANAPTNLVPPPKREDSRPSANPRTSK